MTRFLAILAAAAVAGAIAVAAAPGGLRASGPTARQFEALTKKVASLQKEVTKVKKLSDDEAAILVGCLLYHAQAVDRLGAAGSTGYLFGTSTSAAATTALDLAPTAESSSQFYFLGVNPSCVATINQNGGTTAAYRAGNVNRLLARIAVRLPSAAP